MKEILFAIVLAALIGFVTVCHGDEGPHHRSVLAANQRGKAATVTAPRWVFPEDAGQHLRSPIWLGSGYGYSARHYQIRSSENTYPYDTEYASYPEYSFGVFAPIGYSPHDRHPSPHHQRGSRADRSQGNWSNFRRPMQPRGYGNTITPSR